MSYTADKLDLSLFFRACSISPSFRLAYELQCFLLIKCGGLSGETSGHRTYPLSSSTAACFGMNTSCDVDASSDSDERSFPDVSTSIDASSCVSVRSGAGQVEESVVSALKQLTESPQRKSVSQTGTLVSGRCCLI